MLPQGRFIQRVTIDITSACNLRCLFCPQRYTQEKQHELSLDTCRKIAGQVLVHARELFVACAYEPTLSGAFCDIVRCFGCCMVPKSALVTNGTLLDEEMIESLVDSGISLLVVSVDGARESTYERLRQGASFGVLLRNLALISQVKARKGSRTPVLDLTFTVMRSTVGEMPQLVELARRSGAESVNYKPLQVLLPEMECEALTPADGPLVEEHLCRARGIAADCGIAVHISPEMAGFTRPLKSASLHSGSARKCVEPFPSLYIRPNGDLYPCTLWKGKPLGNCITDDFHMLWEQDEYAALRQELISGAYRGNCRQCCYLV